LERKEKKLKDRTELLKYEFERLVKNATKDFTEQKVRQQLPMYIY